MSKSWYLHTIDGKPAFYSARNKQICYAMRRQNISILVENLATIRKQQQLTVEYRMREGMAVDPGEYGYITFAKATVKRTATKRRSGASGRNRGSAAPERAKREQA